MQYNRLPLSVLHDGYLSLGDVAQPVEQVQFVLVMSVELKEINVIYAQVIYEK